MDPDSPVSNGWIVALPQFCSRCTSSSTSSRSPRSSCSSANIRRRPKPQNVAARVDEDSAAPQSASTSRAACGVRMATNPARRSERNLDDRKHARVDVERTQSVREQRGLVAADLAQACRRQPHRCRESETPRRRDSATSDRRSRRRTAPRRARTARRRRASPPPARRTR